MCKKKIKKYIFSAPYSLRRRIFPSHRGTGEKQNSEEQENDFSGIPEYIHSLTVNTGNRIKAELFCKPRNPAGKNKTDQSWRGYGKSPQSA